MTFRQDWQPGMIGHPQVHNQIAARLNRVLYATDYASLHHAVDAAKTRGGIVYIPPGTVCTIDEPLVLPRTGYAPEGFVQLVGAGAYTSVIKGSAAFPAGRALIEWEPVKARALAQRISGLSLALPDVDGVMAIHYQPTAKGTFADQNAERLYLALEHLYITAHNDYHERLIYLEGAINRSIFNYIEGAPALGDGTYATLLLETDFDLPAPSDIANDMVGLMFSRMSHLYPMTRRGGKCRLFKGRMNGGYLGNSWCNGGGEDPGYELINTIKTVIEDTGTEGFAEKPQYRFENCHFLDGRAINIGTPNGDIVGNGLELIGCTDCRFDGRYVYAGNPAFSTQGQGGAKVTVIDADSARNVFTRWGVRAVDGDGEAELEIAAPESAGNRIEWVDVRTGATGTLTGA